MPLISRRYEEHPVLFGALGGAADSTTHNPSRLSRSCPPRPPFIAGPDFVLRIPAALLHFAHLAARCCPFLRLLRPRAIFGCSAADCHPFQKRQKSRAFFIASLLGCRLSCFRPLLVRRRKKELKWDKTGTETPQRAREDLGHFPPFQSCGRARSKRTRGTASDSVERGSILSWAHFCFLFICPLVRLVRLVRPLRQARPLAQSWSLGAPLCAHLTGPFLRKEDILARNRDWAKDGPGLGPVQRPGCRLWA